MRLTCPSCHALLSLDVLLANEAARAAVARLARVSLPFGALMLTYVGLFRPEQRGLSIERMVRLIEELLPDIERGAITRKGRDWHVDAETWRAAIGVVLAKRDNGTLNLPLASHGLLYEVMAGMVDRVEAAAERQREDARRSHRPVGQDHGPRNLAGMADALLPPPAGATPLVAAAQMPTGPTGPSRAALEMQEQMRAHQARRSAGAAPQNEEAQA